MPHPVSKLRTEARTLVANVWLVLIICLPNFKMTGGFFKPGVVVCEYNII